MSDCGYGNCKVEGRCRGHEGFGSGGAQADTAMEDVRQSVLREVLDAIEAVESAGRPGAWTLGVSAAKMAVWKLAGIDERD